MSGFADILSLLGNWLGGIHHGTVIQIAAENVTGRNDPLFSLSGSSALLFQLIPRNDPIVQVRSGNDPMFQLQAKNDPIVQVSGQ